MAPVYNLLPTEASYALILLISSTNEALAFVSQRAWELKKCIARLKEIDHSEELQALSRERVTLQKRLRRLTGRLVVMNVEHHHMTNMTDVVKSSLVSFTSALERPVITNATAPLIPPHLSLYSFQTPPGGLHSAEEEMSPSLIP